jgi:hypothetical protein
VHEPQNVDFKVIAVQNPSSVATCDVVFVHGLDGDPRPGNTIPNAPNCRSPIFWQRTSSVRVWALGYPAQKFGGKDARAMSIEDRAKAVLENPAAEAFGTQRIIFIAHASADCSSSRCCAPQRKAPIRAGVESATPFWAVPNWPTIDPGLAEKRHFTNQGLRPRCHASASRVLYTAIQRAT